MCQFLSAIVLKNGDVLHHPMLDSHSDLVSLFKLPDARAHHQHFAKVELTPPAEWEGWEDVSSWAFRLDEDTKPGWWDDVAASAEASVRAIIQRAILTAGEHRFHLDGLALIGPGVIVRSMRNGRAQILGGTVSEIWGGTVSAIRGGTVSEIWGGTVSEIRGGTVSEIWGGTVSEIRGGTVSAILGGTVSEIWGGTVSAIRGGTVSEIWGGTVSAIWGGTVSAIWGGTVSAIRGGTVSAISDPYGYKPRVLYVAKGVKLNKAARAFIVTTKKPAAKHTARRKAVPHA